MGRQVMRVPLDFDWPINVDWKGYINPYADQRIICTSCENEDGMSSHMRYLHDRWYGYVPFDPAETGSTPFTEDTPEIRAFAERNVERAPDFYGTGEEVIRGEARRLARRFNASWRYHLSEEDVEALLQNNDLRDFTHTYTADRRWEPKVPPYRPTAAEVNRWSISALHGVSQFCVCSAACERAGHPTECEACDGHGHTWPSEAVKDAYENWTTEWPPTGPGYQIWQTVSAGAPISPVFADPWDLARHMESTRWGADGGTPAADWMKMIMGSGWAPSTIIIGGDAMTGVAGVAAMAGDTRRETDKQETL